MDKVSRLLSAAATCLLPFLTAAGESLPFAGLDDLRGPYDGVGAAGDVLYVCPLGDAGGWPIRAYWSSARAERSPVLGYGWSIPALESKFVQLDGRRWAFHQPDGFVRIFIRRPRDNSNTLYGGDAWTAVLKNDAIRVTADPGDGGPKSIFSFQHGRLVSMTCEEGDFEIKYSGRVANKIISRGKTVLEVVRKSAAATEESSVLRFGGGAQVVATCRPITVLRESADANSSTGRVEAASLATLKTADGRAIEFAYGGDRYKAFFKAGDSTWTWNPLSGRIYSHGEWTYVVGDPEETGGEPAITRIHSDGRREAYSRNLIDGRLVQQHVDGSKYECATFTSGPFAWRKVRWTKTTRKDGTCERTDYSYDLEGRLVYRRTKDDAAQGGTKEVWFGEDGSVVRRRINGREVAAE